LFANIFHWIASNPTILEIVNWLNIIGLILIGLALFIGVMTRTAAIAGMLLLALYYVANPPLIALNNPMAEGNYLFVDKNVIEMAGLLVIALIPTDKIFGVSAPFNKKSIKTPAKTKRHNNGAASSRRHVLRSLATIPLLGIFVLALYKKWGYESFEEQNLDTDADTGATIKTFKYATLQDLEAKVPGTHIQNLELSRMILGGNLIGGWAHARDLIYVSKLVKSYHSQAKVFDTLRLAEACGVNTLLTNPQLAGVINDYWKYEKGNIQFISDCGLKGDAIEGAKRSINAGAHACYVQGEISDKWVQYNRFDDIQKTLELIRLSGLPAGIGAHKIETIQACVQRGIKPDFWVKTLHDINYWSADKENQHDNIWCVNPQETIRFMGTLPEPWIAFKVLAAGAIHPSQGFRYAFENGADFIAVGMYDFQIVDDVNILTNVLKSDMQNRTRRWMT